MVDNETRRSTFEYESLLFALWLAGIRYANEMNRMPVEDGVWRGLWLKAQRLADQLRGRRVRKDAEFDI